MVGSFFETRFFVENRAKLREKFAGTAPIVMTANGLLQRSADTTFPFRQESNFWYLTGINEPDVVLVIDKDKEYLIVPMRNEQRVAFDGHTDVFKLAERAGIETVYEEEAGWKYLSKRLKRVKHVATLPPAPIYQEAHGFYVTPARARLCEKLKSYNQEAEVIDLRPVMLELRAIKRPEELRAIKRAILLTSQAFKKVNKNLPKFQNEYQVDAMLTSHVRARGATTAYQPIVATDENACTLHYIRNDTPLGERLLIDFGAEVDNYAADITRTYSLNKPTPRFSAVHSAVLEVQQKAFSLLGPGISLKDYEDRVVQFMGEKLRELGLIRSIDKESVRTFYSHGTSHFLGLDVHDVGYYDKPLQPGMVLTVEPGIYIPSEKIGVRIEDDVLITKNGIKNLSAALPTSLT